MRCSTAMCFPGVRSIRIHPSCYLTDFLRWPSWIGKAKIAWFGFGEKLLKIVLFFFFCFGTRGVWSDVLRVFFECKMKYYVTFGFWFEHVFRKTQPKQNGSRAKFFFGCFCGQESFSKKGKTPMEAQLLLEQNWIVLKRWLFWRLEILPNFQEISNCRTHGPRTPEKTGVSNSSIATYLGVHW